MDAWMDAWVDDRCMDAWMSFTNRQEAMLSVTELITPMSS